MANSVERQIANLKTCSAALRKNNFFSASYDAQIPENRLGLSERIFRLTSGLRPAIALNTSREACSNGSNRSNSSNRFPARKHSDNLLVSAPSMRFARWDRPGGVYMVGRPEPQQRDGLRSYQAKLSRFRKSGNIEKSIPEGRNRKRRHQPV